MLVAVGPSAFTTFYIGSYHGQKAVRSDVCDKP